MLQRLSLNFVQFLDPKPQGHVNQQGQGYQKPTGQGNHHQHPNPYAGNMNAQNQSANQYGTGGGSIAVSDEDLPF